MNKNKSFLAFLLSVFVVLLFFVLQFNVDVQGPQLAVPIVQAQEIELEGNLPDSLEITVIDSSQSDSLSGVLPTCGLPEISLPENSLEDSDSTSLGDLGKLTVGQLKIGEASAEVESQQGVIKPTTTEPKP